MGWTFYGAYERLRRTYNAERGIHDMLYSDCNDWPGSNIPLVCGNKKREKRKRNTARRVLFINEEDNGAGDSDNG